MPLDASPYRQAAAQARRFRDPHDPYLGERDRAGQLAARRMAALRPMTTRRELPESPYLAAATGRKPSRAPVWFMRQAGRSLPEYRALRAKNTMMQACFDPELITEITLQPVRRHGVDAAILFSDIVVPLRASGIELDIVPDIGPVIDHPVRSIADVKAMKTLEHSASKRDDGTYYIDPLNKGNHTPAPAGPKKADAGPEPEGKKVDFAQLDLPKFTFEGSKTMVDVPVEQAAYVSPKPTVNQPSKETSGTMLG